MPSRVMKLKLIERESCPVCSSSHSHTLVNINYGEEAMIKYLNRTYRCSSDWSVDSTYCLNQCDSCGFVFQKYVPSPESMETLYSGIISVHSSFKKSQLSSKLKLARVDANFSVRLVPSKTAYYLDFGAGWGGWAKEISMQTGNIYAAELSPPRMSYLSNTLGLKLFDTNKDKVLFDYINLAQVLEHVADPLGLLGLLFRVLKPGGIVHVSVPNANAHVKTGFGELHCLAKGPYQPLEHINCFTYKTLHRAMVNAGFASIPNLRIALNGSYGLKRLIKKQFYGAADWYFVRS